MKKDTQHVDLFDVTIRDGSYSINFQFNEQDVREIYKEIEGAGFKYIEIGHGMGLNASSVSVKAASTDDEYLAIAADVRTTSKFGTFFIPGVGQKEHILSARKNYDMDFIRIGQEANRIEEIIPYVEYATSLGYEVMCNFMKTYIISPTEAAKKSAKLAQAGASAVYIVDSAGGMTPDEVAEYVKAISNETDIRIGFHAHNNLELASANSIKAIENGCSLIDCSIGGLGRSAGNTRTELFVPTMRRLGYECNYDEMEILRIWEECILPVQKRCVQTSAAITGGYARVHSGMIQPYQKAAKNDPIILDRLLLEFGNHVECGTLPPEVDLDKIADECREIAKTESKENVLLSMYQADDAQCKIYNTLHSIEETLIAAKSLAHKAFLPVALVVDIDNVDAGDSYATTEYLYHDDSFIFVRGFFSSLDEFTKMMQKNASRLELVVFNSLSANTKRALNKNKSEWSQNKELFYIDFQTLRHNYLMSWLYQKVAEVDAHSVFCFTKDIADFAHRIPSSMSHLRIFSTTPMATESGSFMTIEFERDAETERRVVDSEDINYDVMLLLSSVETNDMKLILEKMNPSGVLIDCVHDASRYDSLELNDIQLVCLDVSRSLSSEIAHLKDDYCNGVIK